MDYYNCDYNNCQYKKTKTKHVHTKSDIKILELNSDFCYKCEKTYELNKIKYEKYLFDGNENLCSDERFKVELYYTHCSTCCKTYLKRKYFYLFKKTIYYSHCCKCEKEFIDDTEFEFICDCCCCCGFSSCLCDKNEKNGEDKYCEWFWCLFFFIPCIKSIKKNEEIINEKYLRKAENHCNICCKTYPSNENHCNICCKTYSSNSKHCIKCCKTYSLNSNHCNKCCKTYQINEKHCNKCCKIYPSNENHCKKCCKTYSKNDIHCNDCCKSYNPLKLFHCEECHSCYSIKYKYCQVCEGDTSYNNILSSKSNNNICSICLENINSECITKCKHVFHNECINEWKKYNNKCPLCREEIFIDVCF